MNIIKSILISLLFIPVLVFAHHPDGEALHQLPNAGLTPESPFYFLDKLGEALRDFFTFNPEAKARLQIAFVGERIAEIKVILETKGVEAKGLAIAQARLEKHAKKAADIVEKEKGKGKDVSKLAGEIVDNFHLQRKAAKQVFEEAKEEFKTKKRQLHEELLIAIKSGNTEAQERIRAELVVIEAMKDEAEAKKDEAITTLESEKDRLQDELEEEKRLEDEARDAAEEAEDAKKEAEERQQELKEKIEEEQAKAEEKMKEAEGREAERIKEEANKELERLEKEQEKAAEEQKRAEERQREAEERLRKLEENE
ncbi:hypothetical protein IIA94_01905 [Patescibacteria group bacterium]|nr:hypothetical protein [Patescibacteria group bacterium]